MIAVAAVDEDALRDSSRWRGASVVVVAVVAPGRALESTPEVVVA